MIKIIKRFFRFLFPSKCLMCKKEGCAICEKCLRKIPTADRQDRSWIISVWSYKDPVIKKLLWMLKFENKFAVVEDFGQMLYDHLYNELQELAIFKNAQEYILVTIPLSRKSLHKRGYNQSEIIAKDIASRSDGGLIVKNLLKKVRETPTQHSIKNRNERLKNLRDAFVVTDLELVKGKNIILIDDITTTNTTLVEAKRVLKNAKAKSVLAFTVAH
jgi:competence protein ComFC